MWTKAFWKGLGERAIKTFFQTFTAALVITAGADAIPAVGLEGVPWLGVLSVSGLATILSVATSIGNADFTAGVPKAAIVELAESRAEVAYDGRDGIVR